MKITGHFNFAHCTFLNIMSPIERVFCAGRYEPSGTKFQNLYLVFGGGGGGDVGALNYSQIKCSKFSELFAQVYERYK